MKSLFFKSKTPQEKHPGQKPSKWKDYTPSAIFWKGYFLADDLVYKSVNSAAGKIQKRFKCGREKVYNLAHYSMFGTFVVGTYFFEHHKTEVSTKNLIITLPIFAGIISNVALSLNINDVAPTNGAITKSRFQYYLEKLRLAMLTLGAGLLVHTIYKRIGTIHKDFSDCRAALFNFWNDAELVINSVLAYLASGSNGMLDRTKKWLKSLKEKLSAKLKPAEEPALVPVEIKRTDAF